MIRVVFLGGAKKSFGTDGVTVERGEISIDGLLGMLSLKKPGDTPELDPRNILVAVNGVDSSALDGRDTVVRSGDVVSIIPVIHGGAGGGSSSSSSSSSSAGSGSSGTRKRAKTTFITHKTNVSVHPVCGSRSLDYGFLDGLRSRHAAPAIQAVSARFILGMPHIKRIVGVSLEARRRRIMLSDRLETDLLLRFAATTQISRAIADLGIRPGGDFVIIAIGPRRALEKIKKELSPLADLDLPLLRPPARSRERFIKRHYKITKKQLDSVSSRAPLEDLLQEKASVLF